MKSLCKEANPRKEQKGNFRLAGKHEVRCTCTSELRLYVTISFVQQSAYNVGIFAYESTAWIHDAFEKHHDKQKLKYFTVWLSRVKKTLP